jgi:hypothetical protein
MALGAASLVAGYGNAEVVQEIVFAMSLAFQSGYAIGLPLPLEVTHFQGGFTLFLVAHKAGFSAFIKYGAEKQFMNIDIIDGCVFDVVLRRLQPCSRLGCRDCNQRKQQYDGCYECDMERARPESGQETGFHFFLLVLRRQ